MDRLAGKIAIVTGASQGMGESHARCMVAEGAKVFLTDVNEKAGKKIAAELGGSGQLRASRVHPNADDSGGYGRAEQRAFPQRLRK
jgi:NAD(P)-dependent dehydrogenase (short-subunit alcohol dehydrogenase family)